MRQIEKKGDLKSLRDYLTSKEHADLIRALDPISQMKAFALAGAMYAAFDKQHPLIKPSKTRGWSPWTEARIKRLREVDAKYGNDDDLARILGITFDAARRARLRYVGRRQEPAKELPRAA